MSVYIVEDNPIQRYVLERMIENLGMDVVGTTDSGTEAIHDILMHEPEIVLMDIQLKNDTSGIDVAKTVLSSYQPAIIFITANSNMKNVTKLINIPSHHFITKPISYHELQKAVVKVGVNVA